MHSGVKYRPDIDGLRALAVLPVVFYHFNFSGITGGFVGVDVFFVISGYLITQVIYADMTSGEYTVAGFYERRIRRILPAYLFVALCSAIAIIAIGFATPKEVSSFKDSLIAATLFASNIYFYLTSNYFGAEAVTEPLLHTWSLAVEEQFYILFPLLLWFVRQRPQRQVAQLIVLLAAISFAISVYLVNQDRGAAFYLLHSRAWELLLGSFLAIGMPRAPSSRPAREAMSGVGLALVLFGVFVYTTTTPFPGPAALAPCLGAALILQSGGQSVVGRLLSIWPVRFIGLISYSLYLWHWPVRVFFTYYMLEDATRTVKVLMVLISIALATFSWWFVERPFRTKPFKLDRPRLFAASLGAMVFLTVGSMALPPLNDRVLHLPSSAERVLAVATDPGVRNMRDNVCFLTAENSNLEQYDQSRCLATSTGKKNYLLIGDSHAAHLWPGLATVSPGINVMQATASGCKPIIDGEGLARCTNLMDFIFKTYLPAHHLDGIILSARWEKEDIDGAIATAHRLEPFADRVIIFGPTVQYRAAVPKLVAFQSAGDAGLVDRNRLVDQKNVDAIYKQRLQQDVIRYFSVYDALCPNGNCRVLDDDGLPLEFDYGHLTAKASDLVARKALESGAL